MPCVREFISDLPQELDFRMFEGVDQPESVTQLNSRRETSKRCISIAQQSARFVRFAKERSQCLTELLIDESRRDKCQPSIRLLLELSCERSQVLGRCEQHAMSPSPSGPMQSHA